MNERGEQKSETEQDFKIELDPKEPVGYFDYKGFHVRYNLDTKTEADMNQEKPAEWVITQNRGDGGETLSIWVWEGVPQKFKEILLYHELIESDLMLNQKLTKKEAHKAAYSMHMPHARENLEKKDYDEFVKWQEQVKFYE